MKNNIQKFKYSGFEKGSLERVYPRASFIETILGQYDLEEGYNNHLPILLSGKLAKFAKCLFSNKLCLDGEYRQRFAQKNKAADL